MQHRDGRLLFGRVEWPWERHVCGSGVVVDFGLDYLLRKLTATGVPMNLAIVAGVQRFWTSRPVHLVAFTELSAGARKCCVRLRRKDEVTGVLQQRECILPGTFVAVGGTACVTTVVTTENVEFECIEQHCSPEELGIPAEWNGSSLIKI